MQHFMFVNNVFAHLVALMSGIVSFVIAVWQAWKKNNEVSARWFFSLSLVFLFIACDLAWQDEHRNTQTVIVEKAAEVSAKSDCQNRAKIEDAYTRGLEMAGLNQRNSIDDLHKAASKTQDTINNCVLSLGKMSPIIREKTAVAIVDLIPFAPNNAKGFVFVITTSEARSGFHGYLTCSSPFQAVGVPFMPKSTSTAMGSGDPVKLNDREYELKVSIPGLDWSPNTPAFMKAYSVGEGPKTCDFEPI